MTTENEMQRAKTFVTSRLPWILGAGMLLVFLATLNYWLTPRGLAEVIDISGWTDRPHIFGPVTLVVTYPLRWLPVTMVPLALNLFSAVCAGLVLTLLARSVSILPHDRTFEQRQREQSEYSFLTIRAAWVPPLFAVLVCGLQLSFWEDATQATGEMFDLLLFAYVLRCLLEYRLWQIDSWLIRAALVFGLAMANNWAMVGLLPIFIVAVVWIKGIAVLNPQFLVRMVLFGLAGCSLYLLHPLLNVFEHYSNDGFWHVLHLFLRSEKQLLTAMPKEVILLLSLTSILPILVIGIRWASYFGDNSPLGIFLATSIFHIVHGLFFIACIWVALGASTISPRDAGGGYRCLPVYYLGALSIGYFSGYFLLIFGTKIPRSRLTLHPMLRTLNLTVTGLTWALLIVVPAMLIGRSVPILKDSKAVDGVYERYIGAIANSLPAKGAVVFSDDSFRLYYLQALLNRNGNGSTHFLVETSMLAKDPRYVPFLAQKNPRYQVTPEWNTKGTNGPSEINIIHFMDHLMQSHDIFYIHPSFGFFFERYSQEPHGLVYKLVPYATNTWDMPLPTRGQIAENQQFWGNSLDRVTNVVCEIVNPPAISHADSWEKLQESLHLKKERVWMAIHIGGFYARSLNYWGVELERAGMPREAGECFDRAIALNPLNVAARINYLFNTNNAITGKEATLQPPKDIENYFGGRRNWQDVLGTDGPLDEPNFRDALAEVLADGGNYRQAVQQLKRVKELVPHDLRAPLQLAQLLLFSQTYTNVLSVVLPSSAICYAEALANVDSVLKQQPNQPPALFLKSVTLMQSKAYDQAIAPLDALLTISPDNSAARLNRAIALYKTGRFDAAKKDYEAVAKVAPNAYQVYYGLGEIAFDQKDTANAVKNYELYLKNAPPRTEEAGYVAGRLKGLTNSVPSPGKPAG